MTDRPWGDMPPEQPALMPVQSFQDHPGATRTPRTSPAGVTERRLLLLLGTLVLATFGAGQITQSLGSDGISLADLLLMGLFFMLFAWIAFG
ncbi:MAG TPA: glucans biosynthesis glucosyltransferase MdoH, partial [Sphingomonas sp.]|nr:glucans biosynthesis glucosyltransferase MdoH [Sphingomonas sp.]